MEHQCVQSYITKICRELETVYDTKRQIVRTGVKGVNALVSTFAYEKTHHDSKLVRDFLSGVKLEHSFPYRVTVTINPILNPADHEVVSREVMEKLFNIGYRIQSGGTMENVYEKEGYRTSSEVVVDGKFPWNPSDFGLHVDYREHFKFWEVMDDGEYISSSESTTPFVLNMKTRSFVLNKSRLEDGKPLLTPLVIVDLPRTSRAMWREMGKSVHGYGMPVTTFLYNIMDADKDNLGLLLKLAAMYRESIDIATMKRLTNIPVLRTSIYTDANRGDAEKVVGKYMPPDKMKNIKSNDLVLLSKTLECYTHIDASKIQKVLVQKKFSLDDAEIRLMIAFNEDVKKYIARCTSRDAIDLESLDNYKLVAAADEDERDGFVREGNVLTKNKHTYSVLLVNHVQRLYRYPVKISVI